MKDLKLENAIKTHLLILSGQQDNKLSAGETSSINQLVMKNSMIVAELNFGNLKLYKVNATRAYSIYISYQKRKISF